MKADRLKIPEVVEKDCSKLLVQNAEKCDLQTSIFFRCQQGRILAVVVGGGWRAGEREPIMGGLGQSHVTEIDGSGGSISSILYPGTDQIYLSYLFGFSESPLKSSK